MDRILPARYPNSLPVETLSGAPRGLFVSASRMRPSVPVAIPPGEAIRPRVAWARGRIGPRGRAGCSLVQPCAGSCKAGDPSRRYFLGLGRAFNPRVRGSSPRRPTRDSRDLAASVLASPNRGAVRGLRAPRMRGPVPPHASNGHRPATSVPGRRVQVDPQPIERSCPLGGAGWPRCAEWSGASMA